MDSNLAIVNQQQNDAVASLGRRLASGTLGLFFALSGVLVATSIVNVGDSGVGLFYLAIIVPVLDATTRLNLAARRVMSRSAFALLSSVAVVALAISITTFLHIVVENRDEASELAHLASRLGFLLYFVIAAVYVRGEVLSATLLWMRRVLTVLLIYGCYQVPAKLFGLPLFLDWLRNNRSFDLYQYDTAGWINIVRSTSVYAEPSQAAIPVIALLALSWFLPGSKKGKILTWVLALSFAAASLSRTIWITLFFFVTGALATRYCCIARLIRSHRYLAGVLVTLILLIGPFWGFFAIDHAKDASAQERSASIVLAGHMIANAPWIGMGWNSFHYSVENYLNVPLGLGIDPSISFNEIHNMLFNYVQQAGLAGAMLAFLPFLIIVGWSSATPWMTSGSVLAYLAVAEFGGDLGYFSISWLWLAILVNMRTLRADGGSLPAIEKMELTTAAPT